MKFVANKYTIAGLMMSAAILAGCGGGGSGGGSTTPTTLPAITINSTNAPDVAANAVSASAGISQSGDVSSLIPTGVTVNASPAASPSLVNASLQQIYKALENQPTSNLVAGVTTNRTSNCPTSGTILATINAAVSGSLTSGDSISLTANNCVNGTSTMNGSFSVTFSNLSGTPGSSTAWSGKLAMTFKNLTITTGSEAEQVNGDMTVGVTQRAHLDADASISGNSLQLVLLRNGATVLDRTLSAYAYHGTVSSNLETYSDNFTVSGNLKGAGTGSLTVATTTLFKQITGAFPHEGVLKVTGAGNTSVILNALDNTNVRLDIDKNGDGVVDETVTTTWAALNARI